MIQYNSIRTSYKNRLSITSEIRLIIAGVDWKIYCSMVVFYFAAMTNLRDFPIRNVPLIYIAFLPLIPLFGIRRLLDGLKKTIQLISVNTLYWLYLILLRLINGTFVWNIVYVAMVVEPMLIFSASGMSARTTQGMRAAFGALITVIFLSTIAGNWIYFIGEPVQSWRITMQSSVGGSLLTGEKMRKSDKEIFVNEEVKRNSGLSYFSFHFSYQLALLGTVLFLLVLRERLRLNFRMGTLGMVLFMGVIGIITNAERASLLSISAGILAYLIIARKKVPNIRIVALGVLAIFVIMVVQHHSQDWEGQSIFKRRLNSGNESIFVRMVIIPFVAVATVIESPLGAGDLSKAKTFTMVAKKLKWLSESGEIQAVHHHFASVILNTGMIGLLLVFWLGMIIWKNFKWSIKTSLEENGPEMILGATCIALAVHSFMHNAGFFEGDPGMLAVSGLLVSSNFCIRKRILRKK